MPIWGRSRHLNIVLIGETTAAITANAIAAGLFPKIKQSTDASGTTSREPRGTGRDLGVDAAVVLQAELGEDREDP